MQASSSTEYEYDLVMYLDAQSCNAITHSLTHFWEQGMGTRDSYLSPATVGALNEMYSVLSDFKHKFQSQHAEWFNPTVHEMSSDDVIGTAERPGYLYDMVRHRRGSKRLQAHMEALQKAGLPPIPGWEKDCHSTETGSFQAQAVVAALRTRLTEDPEDCGLKALTRSKTDACTVTSLDECATVVVKEVDADADGQISAAEMSQWMEHPKVADALASCSQLPSVFYV